MMFLKMTRPLLVGATAMVALAGCSTAPTTAHGMTANSAVPNESQVAQDSPSPTDDAPTSGKSTADESCGPSSGEAAAAEAIAALPAPTELSDITWDASTAEYDGYDPCAALSWSIVTVSGATASSPYAILLFHDGSYLGTATKEAYPYYPDVTRTNDSTLAITYHYRKDGDDNANLSGSTHATVTWDADAGEVEMSGNAPPTP